MLRIEESLSSIGVAESEVQAIYRSRDALPLPLDGAPSLPLHSFVCVVGKDEAISVFAALHAKDIKRNLVFSVSDPSDREGAFKSILAVFTELGFEMESVNLKFGKALREVVIRDIPVLSTPDAVRKAAAQRVEEIAELERISTYQEEIDSSPQSATLSPARRAAMERVHQERQAAAKAAARRLAAEKDADEKITVVRLGFEKLLGSRFAVTYSSADKGIAPEEPMPETNDPAANPVVLLPIMEPSRESQEWQQMVIERERLMAEKNAAERRVAELAETTRLAMERVEAERAEIERLAAEKAQVELRAEELAETARQAAHQMEIERSEKERLAVGKAEAERRAAELMETVRQVEARVAATRAENERETIARMEAERAEQERQASEKAQAELRAVEAAREAAQRIEAERIERERLAAEKAEAELRAAELAKAAREAAERIEAERIERERLAAEKAQAEMRAAELAEAAREAAQRIEAERIERERLAAEKAQAEARAAALAEAAREASRFEAEQAERKRLPEKKAEATCRVVEPSRQVGRAAEPELTSRQSDRIAALRDRGERLDERKSRASHFPGVTEEPRKVGTPLASQGNPLPTLGGLFDSRTPDPVPVAPPPTSRSSRPGAFFQVDWDLAGVSCDSFDEVLEVRQSINMTQLAVEGYPNQYCSAGIIALRKEGRREVFVVFRLTTSNRLLIYVPRKHPGNQDAYAQTMKEACKFLRVSGIETERLLLGKSPQSRARALIKISFLGTISRSVENF